MNYYIINHYEPPLKSLVKSLLPTIFRLAIFWEVIMYTDKAKKLADTAVQEQAAEKRKRYKPPVFW